MRVGKKAVASMATILCIAMALSVIVPFSGAQTADNTPPITNASLSGTPGNNGWYVTNVTVSLSASDDISGVSRTLYSLDGASSVNYTSILTLSDGDHTLTYYSIDNAGNTEATNTYHIKVDTRPPTVNLTIKGNQSVPGYYNGTVTANLVASDNGGSGNTSILYSLDNAVWKNYTGNFTLPDGQYTLYYGCNDVAGIPFNATNYINVFNPAVLVGQLSGNQLSNYWFTTNVGVLLTKPSGDSRPYSIEYSFDGGKNWVIGSSFSITGEGNNFFWFRANDTANNIVSDTLLQWIGIDKSAPTISISLGGDKSSKGWYNGDVTVTLNTADAGAINHTEWSWDNVHWNNYTGAFKVGHGNSRNIYARTTDMGNNVQHATPVFIYFAPGNYDQGAMSNSVYINGVTQTSSGSSSGSGSSSVSTPMPTRIPMPTPQLVPSATPGAADTSSGSNSPLAIAVLVGILAVIAVAAAAYLFILRPK